MAAENQAQSATIGEITTAVGEMDRSTQQNAAMVEETSAAARNLANEVEALAGRAARFNTGAPSAGSDRVVRMPECKREPAAGLTQPVPLPARAAAGGDWTSF